MPLIGLTCAGVLASEVAERGVLQAKSRMNLSEKGLRTLHKSDA